MKVLTFSIPNFFSGNKSPVANGDPHNETTVSEISADITIDSVKDHTM